MHIACREKMKLEKAIKVYVLRRHSNTSPCQRKQCVNSELEGKCLPNNSHYYSLDYLLSIIDEQHLFSYWELSP
jgi:hypothetical protein